MPVKRPGPERPSTAPSRPLHFGGYQFDPSNRQLTRNDQIIALGGQPLDILELLLRQPGQLVSREALTRALWPGAARIDTSRRLNTAVRALRAALEDTADEPRFVETVRGAGYRFAAPVVECRERHVGLIAAGVLFCITLLFTAADSTTVRNLQAPPEFDAYLRAVSAYDTQQDVDADVRSALIDLYATHPGYRPAAMLIARFAVREWRQYPDAHRLKLAQTAVDHLLTRHEVTPVAMLLQGELALYGHWDWETAERALTGALALAPNDAQAHRLLAWLYLGRGARRKAWQHTHSLLAQAPLAPDIKADAGWLLLRLDKAALARSLCADLDGTRARINTLSCRHTAQARLGDLVAARNTALDVMREVNAAPDALRQVANALPHAGYDRFLRWRTEAFTGASWFQRAQLLASAGRLAAADDALTQALRAKEPHLIRLTSTPELQYLRNTESYKNIVAAQM